MNKRRTVPIAVILAAFLTAGTGWILWGGWGYRAPPLTTDTDADQLSQTEVVPTLDTPAPRGKNVIWCASFPMAWSALRDDVIRSPLQIRGAEALVGRLNSTALPPADLPPDGWYAAAGFVKQGIRESIQREVARRFPAVPVPVLGGNGNAVIAYAYLQAEVKFTWPYFENRDKFVFEDSVGRRTAVGSFGIRKEDEYAYGHLRRQIEVLFVSGEKYQDGHLEINEYALDLCRNSTPVQLILACVPLKQSLGETVTDLDQKMVDRSPRDHERRFGITDVLLAPNQHWRIAKRFKELEGLSHLILNEGFSGYYIDTALQFIRFKLDRSGAELSSEAKLEARPIARYFLLNRPHMVIMKKRGAKTPFFVMWVDNADLLSKSSRGRGGN